MREGKASTTAIFVEWARGLKTAAAPIRWLARAASFGLVDHITLRTAAIDAALQRAVDDGIDRIVLLGAGLDGRAWRLPWLSHADVLEIDHPATQALKRDRMRDQPPLARSVGFVSVDFEHEQLGERLDAEGHDPAARTFWIWEGVTPYLPVPAIEATLRDVADRCAPGSLLAMTYATPEVTPVPIPGVQHVVGLAFRTIGEPLLGLSTPEDTELRLRRFGFTVRQDTDQRDWADGALLEPALAIAYRAERLALARRD